MLSVHSGRDQGKDSVPAKPQNMQQMMGPWEPQFVLEVGAACEADWGDTYRGSGQMDGKRRINE